MNPRMRHPGPLAASLTIAVMVLFVSVAKSAQDSQPPLPPPPQHKEITLEQRADIFMARKSYADAADYYYRALKQASFKDPAVWNKMGIALQQENKFHSARQAYNKATHVDPSFAEAWNNLGTVYFMAKKYGKSA